LEFGEFCAATGGFDVLIDDFAGVLGEEHTARGERAQGEQGGSNKQTSEHDASE
jgi:hypothetical protein